VTRLGLWATDPGPVATRGGLMSGMAAVAEAAVESGFDSLWVSELPFNTVDTSDETGPICEAYSLLGALAACTRLIRLGVVPLGREARLPSMLTKIITSVDVISHGRSVLALRLESGADESEVSRVAEALQVCRVMFDDESPTFSGVHYAIEGAVNRPAPVQVGGIPLVVFADASDLPRPEVLEMAGRYADGVVLGGDTETVRIAAEGLGEASAAADRAENSVQVIWQAPTTIGGARSESPPHMSDQIAAQFTAGATGILVPVGCSDQPETITELGSLISDALSSVPAWIEGPTR
jgi:alkanesulfonate monooxygenase SsuD/methylene tetrahydromethanopterin reductase-like flavin-dependent oxidoreductase (luciferase family)